MTSRIDIIGQNGNDAVAYQEDDLTWLAKNVHEWEQGCHYLVKTLDNGFNWIVGEMECRDNAANYYIKQQWQQRRAELQNKPSWDDAPEWANWLAQDSDGEWCFYPCEPEITKNFGGQWGQDAAETGVHVNKISTGDVLGDWRSTLEKRPESKPDQILQPAQKLRFTPEGFAMIDQSEQPLDMVKRYPKYYKDVSSLSAIDVYAVHELFGINDPSGCIQHASKKLLLCGVRTGGKGVATEIKEARDTLTRKLQLMGVE